MNSALVTGSGADAFTGPSRSASVQEVVDDAEQVVEGDPAHVLGAGTDDAAERRP